MLDLRKNAIYCFDPSTCKMDLDSFSLAIIKNWNKNSIHYL